MSKNSMCTWGWGLCYVPTKLWGGGRIDAKNLGLSCQDIDESCYKCNPGTYLSSFLSADATASSGGEAEDRDDPFEHVQQIPGESEDQPTHCVDLQSHWGGIQKQAENGPLSYFLLHY